MRLWRRKKYNDRRLCNFNWSETDNYEPATFHACIKKHKHRGAHECRHTLLNGDVVVYFYEKGKRWTSPSS